MKKLFVMALCFMTSVACAEKSGRATRLRNWDDRRGAVGWRTAGGAGKRAHRPQASSGTRGLHFSIFGTSVTIEDLIRRQRARRANRR